MDSEFLHPNPPEMNMGFPDTFNAECADHRFDRFMQMKEEEKDCLSGDEVLALYLGDVSKQVNH